MVAPRARGWLDDVCHASRGARRQASPFLTTCRRRVSRWHTPAMPDARVLRPMTDADVLDVLRLNEDHVELLSPLDAERLARLRGWTDRADIIVCDGQTAGFVLVFGPGTAYDSANYRWFSERFR